MGDMVGKGVEDEDEKTVVVDGKKRGVMRSRKGRARMWTLIGLVAS